VNLPADHLPGLLSHHIAELRASGLSDEMIADAGIRSETNPIKLGSLLGWRAYPRKMAPAIVYSFVSIDGTNGYCRAKPDLPRSLGGKVIKYESPLKRPNEIYFPPGVAAVALTDKATIGFTEGEKKSLCATQNRFPCIGLVGVWGWKDSKHERLSAALERINWKDRVVYICFDSDLVDNAQIQDAECRLAKLLRQQGATVLAIRIPPGKDAAGVTVKAGIDDFIVANGVAAFGELVKAAKAADDAKPAIKSKMGSDMIDAGDCARAIHGSEIMGSVPKLIFWRGQWMRYRNGCWREAPPAEVRALVARWLDDKFCMVAQSHTGNVLDMLKAHSLKPSSINPPAWLADPKRPWPADEMIATPKQLVHLPSLAAGSESFSIPAGTLFFSTAALDYEFAAEAPRPTAWLDFLAQLWGDDQESIDALQEWFGYFLSNDTSQQKILLLIGPPRSGKGTIARVLTRLLGRDNVCAPTLASLEQNFGLQPMIGKSIAIIGDARLSGRTDQSKVVERLLSISGEDSITVDRKYAEPVTAKLTSRLMILSNELPKLAESSGALTGRMITLRLTRSFLGAEDPSLTNKLLAELPSILLWAVAGWSMLRGRGFFHQPSSSKELADELRDLSSPIGTFLRARCVVAPERSVGVDDIFRAWCDWCKSVGRDHPGTQQTFGRDLRSGVPALRVVHPRVDGGRLRMYEGVGLSGGSVF